MLNKVQMGSIQTARAEFACNSLSTTFLRFTILAVCLFWLSPCLSTELKCSLEHQEVLPEETEYIPGAPFLESQLPKIGGIFKWYKVPDWLVGQWHREEEVSVGAHGAPQSTISKSKGDMVYGHQTDEDQNIWSFYQEPYWQKIDSGPYLYYKLTKSFAPMWLGNGHFAIRTLSDDVKMLKKTGKVEDVCRREEIHEIWRRKDDNKVSALVSIRQFDLKGHPTLTAATHYELSKTGNYREVAFWTEGEDLKASLQYWLSRHTADGAGTELKPGTVAESQTVDESKAGGDNKEDKTLIEKAREKFAQDKAAQEAARAGEIERATEEKSDQ